MIIGTGDIASALTDREDKIYFASGVSNSKETRTKEFEREIRLLVENSNFMDKQLVYFSSLSIFYSDTPYTEHKRFMESLVKLYCSKYCIVRLGNITWGENPNTLINYLKNKIKNFETMIINDVYRYLVDKDEFLHWINLIPNRNYEMNITGTRLKVTDIVNKIVEGKL